MNIQNLIRPNIQKMEAYSSARSEFAGEADIFLDANENPFERPFNRYPDAEQRLLRERLADFRGVKTENVLCGNGSDELIDLLIRMICEPKKDSVLICPPTFGMYEVSANLNDVKVEKIALNLDSKVKLDTEKILKSTAKILFLPNPTAPLGTYLKVENLIEIFEQFNGLVVVDEAYIDFSDNESLISEIKKYPNLIVLQTFSKYWGMAGLRVGMVFANEMIIENLLKIKMPYNVNIFSQQKAIEALINFGKFEAQKEILLEERKKLVLFLEGQNFVKKIFPSEANFLFLELNVGVDALYEFLLQRGIVTRKFKKCGNFLRISVGTPEENEMLKDGLSRYETNPSSLKGEKIKKFKT